jgi:hypothetical protein
MAYSTKEDVLKAVGIGITVERITALHEGKMTDDQIEDMIEEFIEDADKEIADKLQIPFHVHSETHQIDDDISLTTVYLGNYDESYVGNGSLNVQGCVSAIISVCANGVRVKTTDDDYGWTWTHSATEDYITFDSDLSDGTTVTINYEYDPFAVSVPNNIRKASKCLAGAALVEHLVGLRQSHTAFVAEGDSGERIPDREALMYTSNRLKKMAEEALNSYGYGWNFDVVRG